MRYLQRPEVKIPLIFLFTSILWIILSDHFFYSFQQKNHLFNETAVQTVKGSAFVVVVSLLIRYVMKSMHKQLVTSQRELQELFDNTPNPMFVLDAATETICRVNIAALEQFGYSIQELNNLPFLKLKPIQEAQGRSVYTYTKKNGDKIVCQETRRNIHYRNATSVLVSVSDITAIEKTKTALLDSERRLKQVLSSITDGFFIMDKNLCITTANDVFCRLINHCEEEVKGQNLLQLLPALKHNSAYKKYLAAIDLHTSMHFDTRYAHSNRWFRVSAYPYDGGLSVFFRDISREKDNELHRDKNQQNLLALINNTSDLIWSIDSNYRYFTFNEPYEQWYRKVFNEDVSTGKKALNEKQGTEHVQKWRALYARALTGEKFSHDMEFRVDSDTFFTTVSFNPIYNAEKKVIGVGCFLQNITDRKLYEQQIKRQNRKLKEITFITSHKVRVPLTNILGLTEILDREHPLSEINCQIIEHLKTSAHQLDETIVNMVQQTLQAND